MIRIPSLLFSAAFAATAPVVASAQPAQIAADSPALPGYGEVAGQVLGAPLIVDATVRSTATIRGAEAADVPPGRVRYYVTADVNALIRGTTGLPARIGYLVDVPPDFRGRPPRLRRERVLLFARPVSGRPDQLQLTGLDGQRPWSPPLDAMVRSIAREAVSPDAPPEIIGIGNAFHVPGTLPGEGETQIFLRTANDDPISLQILRRPNQAPRWAVSLGEIVDDSAGPPQRDTFLWYRLACGLPPELPEAAIAAESPVTARIAREDYRLVLRDLGPCRG